MFCFIFIQLALQFLQVLLN